MCGILFLATGIGLVTEQGLAVYECASSPSADDFAEGLARRGPDHQDWCQVEVWPASLAFHGSLLQLRGAAPSRNPLQHPATGNVLLFNGEVFGGLEVAPGSNDAQILLEALSRPAACVPAVLSALRGPWALALWHAPSHTLWFGRDAIGRRSLLLHLPRPGDGRLIMASSAPLDAGLPFEGFAELPPGLYSLSLRRPRQGEPEGYLAAEQRRHEWADPWVTWLGGFTRHAGLVDAPQQPHAAHSGSGIGGAQGSSEGRDLPAGNSSSLPKAFPLAPSGGSTGPAQEAVAQQETCMGLSVAAAAGAAGCGQGGGPGPPPDSSDDAVDRLLAALRGSMEVRCRCIEEHSPFPAASPSQPAPLPSQPCPGPAPLSLPFPQPLAAAAGAAGSDSPAAAAPLHAAGSGSSAPLPPAPTGDPTPSSVSPAPAGATGSNPAGPGPPGHVPADHAGPALGPASVLILFSGGLDSTLMAALAHEVLPEAVPIDLASICFAGGASPDRLAALDALEELRAFAPSRRWRLIQVDRTLADVDALRPHLLRLLAPRDTVMDLNIGAALWLATQAAGTLAPSAPAAAGGAGAGAGAVAAGGASGGGVVGGGVATEAAASLAPFDPPSASVPEGPATPAAAAVEQGQRPHTREQQQQPQHLPPRQQQPPLLRQPQPQPQQPQQAQQPYVSRARVVLLGHGADELCGGYGRHRTRFREGGWAGLNAELALDMGRLWQRNLGRDDRLVADLGREARHPFLDEGVVAAVLETPLELVADLRQPPGAGDKRLLRACLRRLGLPRAAARVKRAIQFGSCLGQQSNRLHFGSNRAANARSAGTLRLVEVGLGGE